jgi:predicted transcriptional regulator
MSKTRDATVIIRHLVLGNDPELLRQVEEHKEALKIAGQIYDMRTAAGLSQSELARLVGTSQSAISRLEDADYEGHSLQMLRRIAGALGRRVEIRFVPAETVLA